VLRAADHYLLQPSMGGYRLNSDFGEMTLNLGRCLGYAFGHKENGAMFSHMAMMWAYSLYQRGFVLEGYNVLKRIFDHCVNYEVSRIYPGIPEYINESGRGMYPYLTGAASWLLLTLLTKAFGVSGELGELSLQPKLVREQFDANGEAAVQTLFARRKVNVVYHNAARLEYGEYEIRQVTIDGNMVDYRGGAKGVLIARETLDALAEDQIHRLDIELGPK